MKGGGGLCWLFGNKPNNDSFIWLKRGCVGLEKLEQGMKNDIKYTHVAYMYSYNDGLYGIIGIHNTRMDEDADTF